MTQQIARIFPVLVLMFSVGNVQAQAAANATLPPGGDGAQTREWLRLQTSGEAADGAPEGQDGEVASRVWQRYIDSFSYPIPEKFETESFSSDD